VNSTGANNPLIAELLRERSTAQNQDSTVPHYTSEASSVGTGARANLFAQVDGEGGSPKLEVGWLALGRTVLRLLEEDSAKEGMPPESASG